MRVNLPVAARERTFPDGEKLVATDFFKSRITSANLVPINVSRCSKVESFGKRHDIIRHPDMFPKFFVLYQHGGGNDV